jgi:hypothetical protein
LYNDEVAYAHDAGAPSYLGFRVADHGFPPMLFTGSSVRDVMVKSGKAISIRYTFSQRFRATAADAYRWCTDYEPGDLSLMKERGKRTIRRISEDALLLVDDVYHGRAHTKKTKLVRLDPEKLRWTNTHIAGPYEHSQFIYEIFPEGQDASRLEFTGLQVMYGQGKVTPEEIESIRRELTEEDSTNWKRLATAMERDVSRS